MRHRTDVAGPTTKETSLTDCSLSPSDSCDEVQNYKDTCAKRRGSVLMNKSNVGSESVAGERAGAGCQDLTRESNRSGQEKARNTLQRPQRETTGHMLTGLALTTRSKRHLMGRDKQEAGQQGDRLDMRGG